MLVNQNVYINDKLNITKVEITDEQGKVQICMKFSKIEFNKKYPKDYFDLSKLINVKENKITPNNNSTTNIDNNENNNTSTNNNNNNNNNNTSNNNESNTNQTTTNDNNNDNNTTNNQSSSTKETATIDDVIYPMYLPNNTTLANKETINTDDGQRLILTFDGDNPFVLVEETSKYQEEGLIIPVSGQLDFLTDVIGVVGTNSLSWDSNGIEYYMASSVMKTEEMIQIARSISVLPVSK